MYRRRRPTREKIFFSFDSFLDVVANVIGIIIRLILVAWVGGRSYTATMEFLEETPARVETSRLPQPKPADDPLHDQIGRTQAELQDARRRLLDRLRDMEQSRQQSQAGERDLAALIQQNQQLDVEQKSLEAELTAQGKKVELAALSADHLQKRSQDLTQQIKLLQAQPVRKKELKYHAPVSHVVDADELFFECREGRVAFIDLPAFLHEVRRDMDGLAEILRKQDRVSRHTANVGAFRLRYTFERERGLLDSPANGFRYGLSEWVVEPILARRGETLDAASAPTSDFRRIADALDPNQTVVTFWVYPDSFEIFRRLRDYLYDRQIEVAGRPLPPGGAIAASRNGSKSRGQ